MKRGKPAISVVKSEPAVQSAPREKIEVDERGLADTPFLILTVLLVAIGVIVLFSASYARAYVDKGNAAYYFVRQAGFAVSGIIIMLVVSRINYQAWRAASFLILAGAILFLIAVPLVGTEEKGATRWINLGFVSFQPSELAKVGMVLTFAAMMSMWKDRMQTLRYGVVPYVLIMGVIALLLYLEPHLSATMIILGVGVIMMYLGGTDKKWLILGGVLVALLLVVYLATKGYSANRITAWLHPEQDASDKGYQIIQARYAIGSGGLTGLGFGKSRQKYLYLPEEHNDYIFAIACEELGFIGAMVIITLFVLLIVRGYWIAMHARDRFGALTVAGLITLLALQVFLNIGVVSNFLPATGISLPFFSYGGTALWVNLAEMGIILGVSRQNENNIALRQARRAKNAKRAEKRKQNASDLHMRRDRRAH